MKRYFRFGMIFLAFAVTAMGAWTWRKHIRAQRERADLIATIALLPPDASVAFGVNLAGGRGTLIGEKLKPVLDQLFPTRCDGLDTFDHGVGAIVVPPSGDNQLAVELTGQFDPEKIKACVTQNTAPLGGKVETVTHRQHTIFRIQGFDIGYLDGQHLLLGTGEMVIGMLDRADHVAPPRSIGENADLVAMLEKTDRGGVAWWAGTLPAQLRDLIKAAAGSTSPFVNVAQTRGSVAFRSGIDLQIYLVTGKHTAAEQLVAPIAEVFRAVQQEPVFRRSGLDRYLSNVKLATEGPSFAVRLQLNAKQTDGLFKAFDRMKKRAMMGAFNADGSNGDAVAYSSASFPH
jgi:hypothetical protein